MPKSQNAMHFIKDLFNSDSITLPTAHYLWSIGTCPIPGCILIHCSVQSILTRNGPLNSPRKHVLGPCHARSFQMEFVKSNLRLCVLCAWSTTKKTPFSERQLQSLRKKNTGSSTWAPNLERYLFLKPKSFFGCNLAKSSSFWRLIFSRLSALQNKWNAINTQLQEVLNIWWILILQSRSDWIYFPV